MYKFVNRSLHEGNMSFGHIATFSLPCDNLKTQPQLCFYQKKIFTIIVIVIDIDKISCHLYYLLFILRVPANAKHLY